MSMSTIINNLNTNGVDTNGLEDIIVTDALVAAGAVTVGCLIPAMAIPATLVASVGAIWHMYIKLAHRLGVTWDNGLLRALASAAVTNMTVNLGGMLAIELLSSFIPVISTVIGATLTYYIIYIAGLMFLTMLAKMVKKYGTISNIPEVIDTIDIACDKSYFRDAMSDAKDSFNEHSGKI